MRDLDYIFYRLIDNEGIRARLKELSEDPKYLSRLIKVQMDAVIREEHPHPEDYAAFIEGHKSELKTIRERLISKYGKEI